VRRTISSTWGPNWRAQPSIIEVYRQPADGQYQDARVLGTDAQVSPQLFADLVLSVAEILGQ
jgi:Uma2 family endonuclease